MWFPSLLFHLFQISISISLSFFFFLQICDVVVVCDDSVVGVAVENSEKKMKVYWWIGEFWKPIEGFVLSFSDTEGCEKFLENLLKELV